MEYQIDNSTMYGTICDHSYGKAGFPVRFCYDLGFSSVTKTKYTPQAHLGTLPADYPFAMRGLSCEGSGVTFIQCRQGTSGCGHDKDIYIWCE